MTTKRLQVLMDEADLKRIQRLARREHVTTAEWVRQRLREAGEARSRPDIAAKLAAIRTASEYRFPAPDLEQMLAEIEAGYLDDPSMSWSFVDSNVPMYLMGSDDTLHARAQYMLEAATLAGEALVTDVEVFQEMLHRYHRSGRPEAVDAAFAILNGIIDVTYSVEFADVDRARRLLATTPRLSARDALHLSVMQGHDVGRILSFDAGFDGIPGIIRLS